MEKIRQLGQYTLEEKIGEGGMGTVYKARHAMLRRPTAVKLLNRESATPETIARFEREVQFTSQLTHPNTVEIYDYGRTPGGVFYYAMEYLPGLTLARLVELDGGVPPARAIYILRQICASLEEAHERGLIHRDIKPLNVILCERGRQADFVKVLDFGLVKDVVTPEQMQITLPEVVAGTPLYVAPERLRDPDRIDARSDIYSIGVIGFNLLTGRDTFSGRTVMEMCQHVMHSTPPRPSQHAAFDVPEALDRLIGDCLARDPADRPQSVTQMIEILDSIPEANAWGQMEARRWWQENADRVAPAEEETASGAPVKPAGGNTTVEFPQGQS
jgi:serine/threonine-protein kinase